MTDPAYYLMAGDGLLVKRAERWYWLTGLLGGHERSGAMKPTYNVFIQNLMAVVILVKSFVDTSIFVYKAAIQDMAQQFNEVMQLDVPEMEGAE